MLEFCLNIEQLGERHPRFKEQVAEFEADIFLSIPALIVLKSLENDDYSRSHRALCKRFSRDEDGALTLDL